MIEWCLFLLMYISHFSFFVELKTLFCSFQKYLKIMNFCSSIFDCDVCPEYRSSWKMHELSQLPCLQITFMKLFPINIAKCTVFLPHSSLNFRLIKILFPFKILEKLCFLYSLVFKCKVTKTKYSSYLYRHIGEVGSW